MKEQYFVSCQNLDVLIGFDNESDRNEMALALYQDYIYFLGMRTMNWYGICVDDLEYVANNSVITWETFSHFDFPTQVAFWDEEQEHYVGGIAYGDEIICGCCGGVLEIKEVMESAPIGIAPIISYERWVNVSFDIMRDEERYFEINEEEE